MCVREDNSTNLIGKSWAGRLARLQPWYLLIRYPHRISKSIFAFVSGAVAVGILCGVAVATSQPLIFPSLGPSAFIFFHKPSSKEAAPRNAILAHGAGILIGYSCFVLFNALLGTGSSAGQIAAAAVSMGMIAAVMILADIAHPPAASTTLIISLGLMTRWTELVAILIAVVLLTGQAYLFNRLSGICYPLWRFRAGGAKADFAVAALQTETAAIEPDKFAQIADQLVNRHDVLQLTGKE